MERPTTRFSGADWATERRTIVLIGCGGIGSWTAFNLSRIGHELIIWDGDRVDESNVTGGQFFRKDQVNLYKASAVMNSCRQYGCYNSILTMNDPFTEDYTIDSHIVITGLDSMKSRRLVYESWKELLGEMDENRRKEAILIDGRLTMEMFEVLAIRGTDKLRMTQYDKEYLFTDEEAQELECTTKQSTFGAMGIASLITATLCNHLTNTKLGEDIRCVPFYQRMYYPIMDFEVEEEPKESQTIDTCQPKDLPSGLSLEPELSLEMGSES